MEHDLILVGKVHPFLLFVKEELDAFEVPKNKRTCSPVPLAQVISKNQALLVIDLTHRKYDWKPDNEETSLGHSENPSSFLFSFTLIMTQLITC